MTRKLAIAMLGLVGLLCLAGCATTASKQRAAYAQEMRICGVGPALEAKAEKGLPLDLRDIAQLSQKGVPDLTIVKYVKLTRAIYSLRTQDVDYLRSQKVSEGVINFLLSTPSLFRPRADYGYPYPYPYWDWYYPWWGPVYIYRPYPYYPRHPHWGR